MKTSAVIGGVLAAVPALGHLAYPIPPQPERVLTPDSFTAPAGCKLLPSDKGWPKNETWKAEIPGAFPKTWGEEDTDWWIQVRTPKDAQNAVNFARKYNVRATIITTGHDFHQRNWGRSGITIDLGQLTDLTLSNDWTCGKPIATRKHKRDEPDMPGMKGMDKDDDKPKANIIKPIPGKQAYAKIGAGVYNQMLTDAADLSGLYPMTAQHGGVSLIGGWGLAGGHSPLAHEHGLGVDQIVELDVVTADGKLVRASECENPELFWALRGGGGGTFGVVLSGTIKIHPTPPMVVTRVLINATEPKLMDAFAYYHQQGARLINEHHVQGYYYAMPGAIQLVLHQPGKWATIEAAKAAFDPLVAKMTEIAGVKEATIYKHYEYKSFKDFYDAEMGKDDDMTTKFLSYYDGSDGSTPSMETLLHDPVVGLDKFLYNQRQSKKRDYIPFPMNQAPKTNRLDKRNNHLNKRDTPLKDLMAIRDMDVQPVIAMRRTYLDSRLLSAEDVAGVTQDQLADALRAVMPMDYPGITYRGMLVGDGEVTAVKPDAMGVNPAFRRMLYHLVINGYCGDSAHSFNVSALAKLFPKAGAYVNEASPHNPNWKRDYWGDNYPKLEALKKKYDPTSVFWCTPCVGADHFTYDDERLCPATPPTSATAPPDTLYYPEYKSKMGIFAMPGVEGAPDQFELLRQLNKQGVDMDTLRGLARDQIYETLKEQKEKGLPQIL